MLVRTRSRCYVSLRKHRACFQAESQGENALFSRSVFPQICYPVPPAIEVNPRSLRDYTRRDPDSGAADLLQQRRHKPVSRSKLPSAAAWQKAMDIAASATARWLKRLREKAAAAEEVTPDKNQAKASRASDASMEGGAEGGANVVDAARRKLLAAIAIDLDPDAGFQTIFAALSTCKREAVTVTEAQTTGIGKLVRRLRDSSKVPPMKSLAGELLTGWLCQHRDSSDGTVDQQ